MSGVPGSVAGVPADVALLATHPGAAGPQPRAETGAERLLDGRYCLLVTPMPTVNFVELLDLPANALPEVVAEVRELLRARGRHQAAWSVAASATGLLAELTAVGMTPYTDPPLEPEFAAMALVRAPAGTAGPGVEVRVASELADFLAVGELGAAVAGLGQDDRAGFLDALRRRYELQRQGRSHMTTYLAFVDGQLVGEAQATMAEAGTNLSGSSVLPAARGRGVYRALVAARWDEAVARGRPALTVQAGSMSRPILERLGFATVSIQRMLCDRFD